MRIRAASTADAQEQFAAVYKSWAVSTLEGFDKTFRSPLTLLDVAEMHTWHESAREE